MLMNLMLMTLKLINLMLMNFKLINLKLVVFLVLFGAFCAFQCFFVLVKSDRKKKKKFKTGLMTSFILLLLILKVLNFSETSRINKLDLLATYCKLKAEKSAQTVLATYSPISCIPIAEAAFKCNCYEQLQQLFQKGFKKIFL